MKPNMIENLMFSFVGFTDYRAWRISGEQVPHVARSACGSDSELCGQYRS